MIFFLTGAAALLFLSFFRLVFLLANYQALQAIPALASLLAKELLIGFRFDAVIVSYLLLPLFAFALATELVPRLASERTFSILATAYTCLFSLVWFLCSLDIPYGLYFGNRISAQAFRWEVSPLFLVKMILTNPAYYLYIALFLLSVYGWYRSMKMIRNKVGTSGRNMAGRKISAVYLLLFCLLIAGARGSLSFKTTLKPGAAYISEYAVMNQAGLNPVFTLFKSCTESSRNLLPAYFNDPSAALAAANSFPVQPAEAMPDTVLKGANVVLVFMESMSAFYLGAYNGPHAAPVLDSLKERSWYFSNFYSAGIHTYNGLFSTLTGLPAKINANPLFNLDKKYEGLAPVLKRNGYGTFFFTTHDEQFDNQGGFMRFNGFDSLYSEKDYPAENSIGTWGVPDDFMFRYSIPVMNRQKQPFFTVLVTTSNHPPYILPSYYSRKAASKEETAVGYADWSIGEFLKQASSSPWFKNTVFVFLGDHGINLGHTYEMPLSYHHVPLIIYSPMLPPKKMDCLAAQVDVLPTLAGLLNIPTEKTVWGVNLLQQKRPFVYFTADDKIGCLSREYYFIHRTGNGGETLYRYDQLSTRDLLPEKRQLADSMKKYAFSMLWASQQFLEKKN